MKEIFAVIGNLLALFVYGVGLISPLTPSEGSPSIWMLLLFVGIPLVLFFNAWNTYSSKEAKIFVIFQAIIIISFTIWLLLLQSRIL